MQWIEEHKRNWRKVILLLLVLAIIGPWGFARINVPAEYDCGPLSFRLEGDLCGSPMPGVFFFYGIFIEFTNRIIGLIADQGIFAIIEFAFWNSLFYWLVSILLILPIINILFIIFRRDRPRFRKFHLMVCSLDLGLILLLDILNYPRLFYILWGIWLYIGSLIGILILEGVLLKRISDG